MYPFKYYKEGDKTKLIVLSPITGKEKEEILDIKYEEFKERLLIWEQGTVVQNAFPNLTPNQRKLMISGISNEDFEEMFG